MNLDKVGSRRMLVHIKQQIEDVLSNYILKHNDQLTRITISNDINTLLQELPIYYYNVICDERNNSPDVIDNNSLRVSVVVHPNKAEDAIHICAEIHPSEVIIDESNYDEAFEYAMKVVEPKY